MHGMQGEACMVGGMCGEGVCIAGEACIAGEMTTAADSTHPTRMHSCVCVQRLRSIGKSKIDPETHIYSLGPVSFIFMQFSTKKLPNNRLVTLMNPGSAICLEQSSLLSI